MLPIRLDEDVRSLSEFRSRVAEFVGTVCLTGHPLLITQRGRGMVIVMDVRDYEIMRCRLELLEKQAAVPTPAAPSGH
jgi:antitoxin YefM